jgi:hypothetical protein
MKLTLRRSRNTAPRTFGRLLAEDGRRLVYTLEDEVREIPGAPVADWKLRGRTAIPAGTYRVTLEDSPRFGPQTLTVNDVPGFTHIRMHAGNDAEDTEGCILLGMEIDPRGIVGGTSRPAVILVKSVVLQAAKRGEEVRLQIVNPNDLQSR